MSIAQISGAVALIGSIIGGWVFLDTRHAQQEDVEELAGSFQQFYFEVEIRSLRQRLWQLEDKGLCSTPRRPIPNELRECKWLREKIEAAIRRAQRR